MNNNPYIDLLTKADENNITTGYNASIFLKNHFAKFEEPFNKTIQWDDETQKTAIEFLKDIKHRGYIRFDNEKLENVKYGINEKAIFDSDFNIFLTLSGLDYLQRFNIDESNKSVNNASKRNYKAQIILSIITISVALMGLGMSYFNQQSSNSINDQLEFLRKKSDLLERQYKDILIKQSQGQSPKASPEVPVRKQ